MATVQQVALVECSLYRLFTYKNTVGVRSARMRDMDAAKYIRTYYSLYNAQASVNSPLYNNLDSVDCERSACMTRCKRQDTATAILR
jgi:hypothetical protein